MGARIGTFFVLFLESLGRARELRLLSDKLIASLRLSRGARTQGAGSLRAGTKAGRWRKESLQSGGERAAPMCPGECY